MLFLICIKKVIFLVKKKENTSKIDYKQRNKILNIPFSF